MKNITRKIWYLFLFIFWWFFSHTEVGQILWTFIICPLFVGMVLLSSLHILGISSQIITDLGPVIGVVSVLGSVFPALIGFKIDVWMEQYKKYKQLMK